MFRGCLARMKATTHRTTRDIESSAQQEEGFFCVCVCGLNTQPINLSLNVWICVCVCNTIDRLVREEMERISRKEIERRMNPRTKKDFDILYNELEGLSLHTNITHTHTHSLSLTHTPYIQHGGIRKHVRLKGV